MTDHTLKINRQRLLERFLQYVQIDTTAVEETSDYPSSPGQMEIGRLLVEQMKAMGVVDAHQDQWGVVYGTVPGSIAAAPVVAFNSHVDTAPDVTGKNVKPQVIENFDGQDIVLSGNPEQVITVKTCSELPAAAGKTIVTTDGTTLLGGDDKAGVAIIMELANCLLENPDLPRGDVRVFFTCDEEVGRGVDHVDLEKVNSTVCYNFDGGGQGDIDEETFSADLATIKVKGVNIHPAIAKDKMINANRAVGLFLAKLPPDLSPERTEGRDGFIHPYGLEGTVAEATLKCILRSFETATLRDHADLLRKIATEVEQEIAGIEVTVTIT